MAVDLSMPVLVVDDYSTMIRIIRNLLKQLGFDNIDDASDGSAALNKMRAKKYGLVISDWNMEPMTGYDLLREVRADPNLATTPFIMITAPASPVPASNLSFAVSSLRRNCGVVGLKKRRGCGSKVSASAGRPCALPISRAAAMTARWPRWMPSKLPIATTIPFGIAEGGVWSRMIVKTRGISGVSLIVGGEGGKPAQISQVGCI